MVDCNADFNDDGLVDGVDLGIMLDSRWLVGAGSPIDLDQNGLVNGTELGVRLGSWGLCP